MSVTAEARVLDHLRAAVHRQLSYMAPQIDEAMRHAKPSNSRLGGLANSLAWHQSRPTPVARMLWFVRELDRLQSKAKEKPDEAALYAYLLETLTHAKALTTFQAVAIAAGRTEEAEIFASLLTTLGPKTEPDRWRTNTLTELHLPAAEIQPWGDLLDLLLAVGAVRLLQMRARATLLMSEIDTIGGKVRLS